MSRGRWWTAFQLSCPACGMGKPFTGLLGVRELCEVCGYHFEREPGYFMGSIYFNYGVTVAIEVPGYFFLEAILGLTFFQQCMIWLGFSFLFPLWFLRYARSLWMALDHSISPPLEEDFAVRSHGGESTENRL